MEINKIEETINDLIEKNYDAYHGYLEAAERVDNLQLARYLRKLAENSIHFLQLLRSKATYYINADDLKFQEDINHCKYRWWMDSKFNPIAIGSAANSNQIIFEECVKIDITSVNEYVTILQENISLPSVLKIFIKKQKDRIKSTLCNVENYQH